MTKRLLVSLSALACSATLLSGCGLFSHDQTLDKAGLEKQIRTQFYGKTSGLNPMPGDASVAKCNGGIKLKVGAKQECEIKLLNGNIHDTTVTVKSTSPLVLDGNWKPDKNPVPSSRR